MQCAWPGSRRVPPPETYGMGGVHAPCVGLGIEKLSGIFLIGLFPVRRAQTCNGRKLMCGIVGLLAKKPALRERLGELMVPMLIGMTERGPDSAGLAVF